MRDSPPRPRTRRPRTYSWEAAAAATLALYETILGAMTAVAIVFWVAAALLVYTQVGYALLLACWPRLRTATASRPRRTRGSSCRRCR